MIKVLKDYFILETASTTYLFRATPSGQLEHLYYGKKITWPQLSDETLEKALESLVAKSEFIPGNTVTYEKSTPNIGLESMTLEFSSEGKGDVGEPFISLLTQSGIRTCDFKFFEYQLLDEKPKIASMPSAYGKKDELTSLVIRLKDAYSNSLIELYYHVFYSSNVITKHAKLINKSEQTLTIHKMMSHQIDFSHANYELTSFTGAWAREMKLNRQAIKSGTYIIDSRSGVSSNRQNPFFMISKTGTSETQGDCFGFNLVYSGNHYSSISVNAFHQMRILSGIHPSGFSYALKPGDSFETPEAIMSFSNQGFTGMSQNMHAFIRNHIVRGQWKDKTRPVLINSWEAHYFDFNEAKLLRLAKKAKQLGIELFVLDDGWFGRRNDDTSSLGDWTVNTNKLANGLKGLSEKINQLGMDFGIWVEPEMVNPDSDLYRRHPEWAVEVPNFESSLGRNQLILDLTNKKVQDYVIDAMTQVFSSANIAYVKWDMNRIFTDTYSSKLTGHQQLEFSHRYVMGLYRVLEHLTEAFPHILFESCASGGNRFDLGMLSYMPQVWASDNTDAISRLSIQANYSYGYPQSVIGAHVSDCPNHQTLRDVPLSTRYHVATFGLLGYEMNLCDCSPETLSEIKRQVENYKKWRKTLQFGSFYRIENTSLNDGFNWMIVSEDKKEAVGGLFQTLVKANDMFHSFYARGLDENAMYRFYNIPEKVNIKKFGDLINTASPIHIKNGSYVQHLVSKLYQLEGESEDTIVPGGLVEHAGIKLKQAFGGVGFNHQVRLFGDFASRLYYFERINLKAPKGEKRE